MSKKEEIKLTFLWEINFEEGSGKIMFSEEERIERMKEAFKNHANVIIQEPEKETVLTALEWLIEKKIPFFCFYGKREDSNYLSSKAWQKSAERAIKD